MKTKIRRSVFETNSSSMHSLSMIGSDRLSQFNYGNGKIVTVKSDEYGWSGDDLTTPLDKLSYIVTMIQYKDNEIKESSYFKWLQEMFKDYTGCELIYEPCNKGDEYYEDGYIDHQSTDILDDVWSDDRDTFKSNMRDIVFNDKYFIEIDNDNH
jgi:hypothetical protein